MRVQVPDRIVTMWRRELRAAGRREIGGVLVGERLGGDFFRIADASVQRGGGTSMTFERDPAQHRLFLESFFARTGHDYARFNYLGEWHSHPNAIALPSSTDVRSMMEIVCDPEVNAAFAALLIVRRGLFGHLHVSAAEFRCGHDPSPAYLMAEPPQSRRSFKTIEMR